MKNKAGFIGDGLSFMQFYAHSKENVSKDKWQLLKEHLNKTAQLAGEFAKSFNAQAMAHFAGLLHDIGKYSTEFQKRLEGKGVRVDHSTAGAKKAVELLKKPLGHLLAYIIIGHHGGLPNAGSLNDVSSLISRLNKEEIPDINGWNKEINVCPENVRLPFAINPNQPGFSCAFLIRMLYSCIVDADSLDTQNFIDPETASLRPSFPHLKVLEERLYNYMEDKMKTAEATLINKYRAKILQECRDKSVLPPGLFSLTVPTGGGKTFSSLSFALKHAVHYGMERIIYVIPFTSIIEQVADQFRQALGDDVVLEHHSNFQVDETFDDDIAEDVKYRLMAENWDAPVIVTTSVQFFESLFSSRRSRCRKLHNIAKSVIVLDEAQSIPVGYLKPCIAALQELVRSYNCSVVLCTATQPALEYINVKPVELIDNPELLTEVFKRVNVVLSKGYNGENTQITSDEELCERISAEKQVLCIVNTRQHAQKLYNQIHELEGAYHLSARMCPKHRSKVLGEIRNVLSRGLTCRLISTQLIEAGVDVDFPVVYRAMAGLDSIAQAAGRCNREGKRNTGRVIVFEPESHGMPKGWISRTASVTRSVIRNYDGELLSLEAIKQYFSRLYNGEGSLDEKDILKTYEEGVKAGLPFPSFQFADWDYNWNPSKEDHRLIFIEQDMKSIIIPWDEKAEGLLEKAKWSDSYLGIARKLQAYTVQVYPYEFNSFINKNLITWVADYFPVLNDMRYYSDKTGLLQADSNEIENEILIF